MTSLEINLSKKQLEAWHYLTDDKTRSVGYGGGARGGKTRLGCMWLYAMCCKYPGITMFIGRRTLVDLRRTTLVEWFKMIRDFDVSNCELYNNSEIRFTNGSKVLLLDLAYQPSDPHASSLDGLVLQGGLVDEANEIHTSVINTLYTRIMADNRFAQLYPKILETFNPDKGRVYSKFYIPYKNGMVQDGTVFIPALAKDNPYCEAGYVESILASGDELSIQRKVYGNFDYDDETDNLLAYTQIMDMFSNIGVSGDKSMSIDVAAGGDDSTVIMVWDGYIVIECIQIKDRANMAVENTINALKAKYNIPKSRTIIDAIGVGFGLANDYGTAFKSSNKADVGYTNLRSQCYCLIAKNADKISLAGIPTAYRERVVKELSVIKKVDKLGKLGIVSKEDMKWVLGYSPDFADALSMRMMLENSNINKLKWQIV